MGGDVGDGTRIFCLHFFYCVCTGVSVLAVWGRSHVGRGGVLSLALSRVQRLCYRRLPRLATVTRRDLSSASFGGRLRRFLAPCVSKKGGTNRRVQLLVDCSKGAIRRLSGRRSVRVRALSLLQHFLAKGLRGTRVPASLFLSLCCLFGELRRPRSPLPSPRQVGGQARH